MSAVRRFVTGLGWCYLDSDDGEVLEVIGSDLVGCGAATGGSALGPPGEPSPVLSANFDGRAKP